MPLAAEINQMNRFVYQIQNVKYQTTIVQAIRPVK